MKILVTLLATVLAFAITAQAQTTDTKPQASQQPSQGDQQMQTGCRMMGGSGMGGGGMTGGKMCGMMGGGKMGCMMNHGAMTRDVLDVVTEILKMQQKVVEGVKPSDKDALLKEIARLLAKVEQMQKTAHSMPMMMHNMPMDHSPNQPDKPEGQKDTQKTPMPHQH